MRWSFGGFWVRHRAVVLARAAVTAGRRGGRERVEGVEGEERVERAGTEATGRSAARAPAQALVVDGVPRLAVVALDPHDRSSLESPRRTGGVAPIPDGPAPARPVGARGIATHAVARRGCRCFRVLDTRGRGGLGCDREKCGGVTRRERRSEAGWIGLFLASYCGRATAGASGRGRSASDGRAAPSGQAPTPSRCGASPSGRGSTGSARAATASDRSPRSSSGRGRAAAPRAAARAAPTTPSPSRSARAPCWRGCARCCAAPISTAPRR